MSKSRACTCDVTHMLRRTPWHVGSDDVDFSEQATTGFVEVAQERVQSSSLEFCTAADVRKYGGTAARDA